MQRFQLILRNPASPEVRETAMRAFVGIRKERTDIPDAVEYIQGLRRGGRLVRLRHMTDSEDANTTD